MQIQIEYPYYAEFRSTRRRLPRREYLLACETFELRETDPAAVRTACLMDASLTDTRSPWVAAYYETFGALKGKDAPRRPAGTLHLLAENDRVYWPEFDRTGSAVTVGGLAAHLHLDRIGDHSRIGPRDGIARGKPRLRTAEEAEIDEFIVDGRDLCRAEIAGALRDLVVHNGAVLRERGEPLYRIALDSLSGSFYLSVVGVSDLGQPNTWMGFPQTHLFRADRHSDADALLARNEGIISDAPAIELVDLVPRFDPIVFTVEQSALSLAIVFDHLRGRRSRWESVPEDLRRRIDDMFPSESRSPIVPDASALMDLLEDCDRRLHPIYWERPDAAVRRPARELMEYTAAFRAMLADEARHAFVERPDQNGEPYRGPIPG